MKVSTVLQSFAALALLAVSSAAWCAEQPYPNKHIRLISPYAPGGGNSLMARLVGERLTESWGRQVIVDNRPGGNTIIGTAAAAKATPDGYTMLLAGSSHVIVPLAIDTPYHPIRDFAAIGTIAKYEQILVVNPSLPAKTLQEFIALAKSRPGQLNYVTFGSGSSSHLAMELLSLTTGIRMQHIPHKGTGPALTDVIGGHADAFLSTPSAAIPHIRSGRLRALAVSGQARSPAVPDVPSFSEAGLPGFEVRSWYGLVAPAGTPKPIVEKVSGELARIIATPDMRDKLSTQGVEPYANSAEGFTALLKSDMAKWAKVIKAANIKLEN
ncbi:MAG TPA: tripartite tricarboxylate transporter substrate binding protein [Burkholderiales bacterium]|nr:tripartite tricarboxylate transporter substrate binding protein [Burkholderiales bacterium]